MQNRIYQFLLVILVVIIPIIANSQNSVSSPYSRYGIGNTNIYNNAINNSMGGIGYTMRANNHVNYLNPASYSAIDTNSLVFDIGFYSELVFLSTNDNKSRGNNSSISHILIGLPIHKTTKLAFGLLPMSNVNYTSSETISDTVLGSHKKEYGADGGISKALLGLSYYPISNLSFGANFEYLFGNYYKSSTLSFPDSLYMYSSRKEENYNINSFNFNLGAQYYHKLNNGDKLGFGLVYNMPLKLSTDNVFSYYTFTTSAGLEYVKDSILETSSKGKISYPQSIGLGLSYEREGDFYIGMDGNYTSWSDFLFQSDRFNQNLVDDYRVSIGSQWRPNAYGTYFEKMVYRAGISYNTGMLEIFDTRLNQIGVSLGFGLPIKKSNTLINFSIEYQKRGSRDNGLIREDYIKFGLSFSAKDNWFFKRKYQ